MRSLIAALLLLVSTGAAAEEFKRGETVDGVACAEHPEITYAYYLPMRYTPQQHWPVLFVFDPRQRGAYAAELFRGPAEQFGCGRPPASRATTFRSASARPGFRVQARGAPPRSSNAT